ncbi:outer membrane protein [Klebsiella pneumoniae]|nr:outer membrane protein [Klebsiella pneumoniae]
MENPASLLRRLNPCCARAMEGAASLCQTRAHAEILPEHWLLKLLEQGEGDLTVLARRYEWDMDALWEDLLNWLDKQPRSVRHRPQLSDHTLRLMQEAWLIASLSGEAQIRSVHLLMALVEKQNLIQCDGLWPLLTLGQRQLERLRPLLPPRPVQRVAPDVIRLDSMSLFDTGKWVLKPGSTKRLVSSLMDIKARPGWLIVVAGHTDSVGEEKANQLLSLKRAESVRDWMRDTGDVPDSCFAVQGYGESRPIATNDTPEGRALNRRVEISLVPQVDACRLPDQPSASSQDDGASLHNGE